MGHVKVVVEIYEKNLWEKAFKSCILLDDKMPKNKITKNFAKKLIHGLLKLMKEYNKGSRKIEQC